MDPSYGSKLWYLQRIKELACTLNLEGITLIEPRLPLLEEVDRSIPRETYKLQYEQLKKLSQAQKKKPLSEGATDVKNDNDRGGGVSGGRLNIPLPTPKAKDSKEAFEENLPPDSSETAGSQDPAVEEASEQPPERTSEEKKKQYFFVCWVPILRNTLIRHSQWNKIAEEQDLSLEGIPTTKDEARGHTTDYLEDCFIALQGMGCEYFEFPPVSAARCVVGILEKRGFKDFSGETNPAFERIKKAHPWNRAKVVLQTMTAAQVDKIVQDAMKERIRNRTKIRCSAPEERIRQLADHFRQNSNSQGELPVSTENPNPDPAPAGAGAPPIPAAVVNVNQAAPTTEPSHDAALEELRRHQQIALNRADEAKALSTATAQEVQKLRSDIANLVTRIEALPKAQTPASIMAAVKSTLPDFEAELQERKTRLEEWLKKWQEERDEALRKLREENEKALADRRVRQKRSSTQIGGFLVACGLILLVIALLMEFPPRWSRGVPSSATDAQESVEEEIDIPMPKPRT